MGKPWTDVFQGPDRECLHLRNVTMRYRVDGVEESSLRPQDGLIVMKGEKGEIRRQVAFYSKVITGPDGNFLAFLGLSRDVTLQREMERLKNEFVSNVSHELRTPLTSIRAYAEMLIDGEAEDPAIFRDYLSIILRETERLTRLINDILDLAKLELGRKVLHIGANVPGRIINMVVSEVSEAAQKKQINIQTHGTDSLMAAELDPDLFRQGVKNLLDNAVKFSSEGGSIMVSLKSGETDYRVEVSDNGPGIAQEDQKWLFNKFFRVESTLHQETGGTGLGLALVRQIAMVHGGTVSAVSELGKGATFTLTFPLRGAKL